MRQELVEINALYLRIQDYVDPTVDYLEKITPEEQLAYERNAGEYHRIYSYAIEKYKKILPNLSPSEIIEGYQQGCRLLQRSLSGWMCHHFDKLYVPIMVESIRKGEAHTAYLFLQALADNLGKEISPIVIESLESESALMRSTALAVARQLALSDAYTKIKSVTNDPDNEVAYLARRILEEWETGAQ